MTGGFQQLLPSYHELIGSLLPGCHGICLLDRELDESSSQGNIDAADFRQWLRSVRPELARSGETGLARRAGKGNFQIALTLADPTAGVVAILGVALSESEARSLGTQPGQALRKRLKPALEILGRELLATVVIPVERQPAAPAAEQFDLATGLLTRSALEDAYRALPGSVKSAPHSVLHVDIDRLHVINNAHGHEVGDAVISMVAGLLEPPLLPKDSLIARIAGDQFLVIMPGCDTHGAGDIASSLQRAAARPRTGSLPAGLELTLSCGVSAVEPGSGLQPALLSAESACQAAKERGRNRVETFGSNDSSIIQRHGDALRVLSLEDALKTNRFELFGQPIVPLTDLELPGGLEVLLRLRNEEGGLSAPDEFLPAAHRYQMMPAIDRWVLDHTLDLVEAHASMLMRRQISLSVNVTGYSLANDQFVDYLLARTRASHFPARLLTVEITEQTAVRNLASAARLMNKLRTAGCGVALDDFGTGTNSLVYLRDLPVTRVKIDGSFVREIATSSRAEATLKSIVDLLRPFDVDIVAEYVENETIIRKVRQLGIDYAQGFAYGRPGPLAQALEALKNDDSRKLQRIALEF